MRRSILALACAAVLVPAASAHAAVGADNYGDAQALLFSAPGTVADNTSYGVQPSEPLAGSTGCPGVTITRTAWWRFAGTGQPITLSTGLSTFDTVLAVYDAPSGTPIAGNRLACNDDSPSDATSQLSFASVRGKSYLVQVGSRLNAHGRIDVTAASARPANDDRIRAQVLQSGVPAMVSNAGASQEQAETLTCATASFAATIWFKWTAPAVGNVVFSSAAAFGDTVVTVYRDGAVAGCNAGSTAAVALRVAPGDYLVQVATKGSDVDGLGVGPITARADFAVDNDVDRDGDLASTDCNDNDPSIRHGAVDIPDDGIDQDCDGVDAVNLDRDGDGEKRPLDCNDSNAAIRHGAVDIPDDGIDQDCSGADAVNLDRDGDGENRPLDCNDNVASIHHGAVDIPGNAIDEDCSGGPAPFPRLESTVRTGWRLNPFRLTKLTILRAVAGSRVELRCSGGGCPFARQTVAVRKSADELPLLSRKLTRARLRRGAVLEVRITMPGHVGFLRRHVVIAAGKDPRIEERCLPPGGGKPTRC